MEKISMKKMDLESIVLLAARDGGIGAGFGYLLVHPRYDIENALVMGCFVSLISAGTRIMENYMPSSRSYGRCSKP